MTALMGPTPRQDVLILCGGRGTRLQERTQAIPKPLVEIGGRPIVWHVIQIYAAHGFKRFLLLTGYKSESIDEFAAAEPWPEGVEVETVFTGEDTPTGGRIHAAADRLDNGSFCVTYADGVADIALGEELEYHEEHGALATMAVVRPELQFGITELGDDGGVTGLPGEAALRALDQRRVLLLRIGRSVLPRPRERARTPAARGVSRRTAS